MAESLSNSKEKCLKHEFKAFGTVHYNVRSIDSSFQIGE
jgi:hypothetical protein